ncbi:MAG: DUF4838 domain-containing protein [Verrucomicrobiota bacterium]
MAWFGTLACNGQIIIQAANPSPAEQTAAQELCEHLTKVTALRYEVMSETNVAPSSNAIYVGWTDFALTHGCDGSALGNEEWIIKSFGENLVLTGGRPRGTLYAVYEFLEKQVGCHWFDELTETIPTKSSLTLEKLNIRGQPAFWDRRIYTGSCFDKTSLFCVRNKSTDILPQQLGSSIFGTPGACHTFYAYSREWPTNHPEYLALNYVGRRVVSTSGSGPGQICLSNPDVRKIMRQQLKDFIAKNRAAAAKAGCLPPRVYVVAPNDVPWMCQCLKCKIFSWREGADSGPLLDLVNELADGIKDEYPDVLVETFAYANTLKPPRTIRPRDNVIIRLAQLNADFAPTDRNYIAEYPDKFRLMLSRIYNWWNKDHVDAYPDLFRPMTSSINRQAYAILSGWSKIAKHLACWDYWVLYHYATDKFPSPYVNLHCLQPDLKLFHDSGMDMMFVECEYPETTSFFALKRWLGYKLMQDPDQDPAPLVKTFMTGYYGPAAGIMMEYLNFMEQRIAAVPETINLSALKPAQRPYLDLAFYTTCQRLLDSAEALCGTNARALLNVQRERIPLDGGLYCMWTQLKHQLPASQLMPWNQENILQRYKSARLTQMEARCSGTALQKGKDTLPNEIRQLRAIAATARRKAEPPPVLRVPGQERAMAAGDPAEVDWSKAIAIGPWHTSLNGAEVPADRQFKGALTHDGQYFYILLEESMQTAGLSSMADILMGDAWELFFAAQRGKAPYRQMTVSPDGKYFYDERAQRAGTTFFWRQAVDAGLTAVRPIMDGGWPKSCIHSAIVQSSTTGGRWQVLIAIPLADLVPNGVQPGRPFYMNVFRTDAARADENICWSPPFENIFHDLTRLAEIDLE